jgi:hypothetical protein
LLRNAEGAKQLAEEIIRSSKIIAIISSQNEYAFVQSKTNFSAMHKSVGPQIAKRASFPELQIDKPFITAIAFSEILSCIRSLVVVMR